MRKLATISFTLCLLALTALAADVNGKWVAQMPGRGGQTHEATFTFKADGDMLTGSISGPRGEMQISDGKITGDEISFSQTMEFKGNQMKVKYTGTVSGDQIKFTRMREGGQGHGQEFTAKRAS